ncbi:RDD family protein [Paenibacillus sp. 481]|uniref:RDD family protein n=1 Tax=Paenibacillus sp. 481 TaxID=2835869 RepID=UPI001E34A6A0|nr:RDD family protein [Paenibacillus sp. 481]
MESSRWQATFGKRSFDIVVVDEDYERLSFLRASARYWSKLLSLFPLYIEFL